uniref:Uncharacterized protein n=1 Tax=Anguilla anguilla TaxID=7936 RepID=A0A0E9URR3_ANGAN
MIPTDQLSGVNVGIRISARTE